MALTATIYRFQIDVSDVDRGLYEALDVRAACHPSETMRALVLRTLAYCLVYEDGISFGKGLSTADEPAITVRDLTGNLRIWVDVGAPSAERLHRAAKAAPRVVVFTHQDLALLRKEWGTMAIFHADAIEVRRVDPAFLDAVGAVTDRSNRWELLATGGQLYLTSGGRTFETAVTEHRVLEV